MLDNEQEPKAFHYTNNGAILSIGDCFYYRGEGSQSAAVNPVIVRTIEDNIVGLSLIDLFDSGFEDAREVPSLFVELRRIEVVQRRGPIKAQPPQPEIPPLPKQFLKAAKKRLK